ncbi:PEBP-like protein [Viridothelium virens]|uniref:PEBP-like protein n=1 Tax=Viridothelium virens TaxID=1048519 RepID=A0A6A6HAX3_VIRVR|nr:PEBP-like protein [Viridothelium virens]
MGNLPTSEVAEAPTLGNPGLVEAGSKYTLVMVDYDVDVSGTQTSVLQWYQPDYALDSSGNNLVVTNTSATNASYISPQPNQGSPHTYVAILYQQPSDYELPSCLDTQLSVRGGLDLRDFTNAAGLGQAVAADWFQVQNPIPATTTYPITSTSVLSYDCSRTAH